MRSRTTSALLARLEALCEGAVLQDGEDAGVLHGEPRVADEVGLPALLGERHEDRVALDRSHLARLPRALLLGGELALEARGVDPEAPVAGELLGEVERQAVGVVEAEHLGPGQGRPGGKGAGDLLEDGEGLLEGRPEALLLDRDDAGDRLRVGRELRVGGLHAGDHVAGQLAQEGALDPELLPVPHRAAHDLAQDVAPALVAGQHAVGDEEGRRAQVVGDHAHRHVVLGVLAVGLARPAADRLEEGCEEVGVVVGELALHDRRHPLEAHAGVDAGRGQGVERPLGVAVVLHEDEVPDLEPPVALALDAEARPAGRLLAAGKVVALEEVDLGAGPAGAGLAHGPEVVLRPELEDPVGRDVGGPEAVRLGVARDRTLALEDRDLQAVLGEAELAGEEVPAELDRLLLEVVAEGEVAEHLEEGVVAGGHAHVLEVVVLAAGAHALLRGGGARVVPLLPPEEDVLELVHPRVREEEGGVVLGHERRALHHAVPPLLEVPEERAADLVGRLHHGQRGLPGHSFSPARASAGSAGSSPSRASFQRGHNAERRSFTSAGAKPRRSRNAHRRGSRRAGSTRACWRQ